VVTFTRTSLRVLAPSTAVKDLNWILPAQKLGVEIQDFVLQPLFGTLQLLRIMFDDFLMSASAALDVCSQRQWDAHQVTVSHGSLLLRSHSGAVGVMPSSRLARSGGNGRSSTRGQLQNLSEKQGGYK